MYFENATRKQLLQIALYEECPNDYKYTAARELQLRMWQDSMLNHLVRLWGRGFTSSEISYELGVPESTIKSRLKKYGLYKGRVNK